MKIYMEGWRDEGMEGRRMFGKNGTIHVFKVPTLRRWNPRFSG